MNIPVDNISSLCYIIICYKNRIGQFVTILSLNKTTERSRSEKRL